MKHQCETGELSEQACETFPARVECTEHRYTPYHLRETERASRSDMSESIMLCADCAEFWLEEGEIK